MPANVTAEFLAAQRRYEEARTTPERIEALREMISTIPKHKGSHTMLRELTHKLAVLKKEQISEKKKKAKRKSISVPKEGFQVVIIGFPNSGKSTLLNKLTNTDVKVSNYPFTTKKPEVGIMNFEGGHLQLVEIPALVEGGSEKQAELLSIVSSADGIIMILGDRADYEKRILGNELRKARIFKPLMIVYKGQNVSKREIFEFFDLIRVFTKEPGEKPVTEKALILRKGATVLDAAKDVHKDFARKLKYARVWGSARFPGQRVEKDYILKDGDVIELHI